jgi:hypothetical protein
MEIVTKEQMDELDGLIEKYRHPEPVSETVAEQAVTIIRYADVSVLEKRKENLVTQEQCKNIVTAASALLKNIPDVHTFAVFLDCNSSVFYFDPLCFIDDYYLTVLINKDKVDIENLRNNIFIRGLKTGREKYVNYNKIVETYTELANFYEYIKRCPLTKDDVLNNISTKQNC